MKSKKHLSKRLATTALGFGLVTALASCSGATNTYGSLPKKVYAESGDYKLTYKELWNELQWNASDVLTSHKSTVVLSKYTDNIRTVETKNFEDLTDSEKKNLQIDTTAKDGGKAEFARIKDWYDESLTNYVIQDIYNLNFNAEGYDESVSLLSDTTRYQSEIKYVDEIYSNYQVDSIGSDKLSSIVVGAYDRENDEITEESKKAYLRIANSEELRTVYYNSFGQELLAYYLIREDAFEEDEADDNEEDTNLGYFSYDDYAKQFKNDYIDTNDVEALLINFTTEDEFNTTLKAFGLKFYNKKLYFIQDNKSNMTYNEYSKYYDDFSDSQLSTQYGAICVNNTSYAAILEIYVQMYNYIYGGYRQALKTGNISYGLDSQSYSLDTLRALTNQILSDYTAGDEAALYKNAKENILDETTFKDTDNNDKITNTFDDTKVVHTADEVMDMSSGMKTLLYTTLDSDDISKCFSTSLTSTSNGYYFAYKLDELEAEDEATRKYAAWYEEEDSRSTYEIVNYILSDENKDADGKYGVGSLKYELEEKLLVDKAQDNKDSYVNSEISDCSIKIYNEATEISYSIANSSYKKVHKKNSNKNILATIKYNGTKYNLYIYVEDGKTYKNAVTYSGSDEAIGAFNYIESTSGATTAVTLLSNKMIKDTQAYKDTKKYSDDYEDYIDNILLNFSNGGYESQGYSASIGKYNFLMKYFHSAKVKDIINNYYRLQYASVSLLADYSNDTLIEFLKNYTDTSYEKYFSLNATRFYAYYDGDDDGEADDVTEWSSRVVEDTNSEFFGMTFEEVAKNLVYDVYTIISASTDSHTDKIATLVEEINGSQKAEYSNNPIKSESLWAKYRHLGFKVSTEDITATNSTTNIPYTVKQRLYDYSNGVGTYLDKDGNSTEKYYQYFLEDSENVPSCYIEPLVKADAISAKSDLLVESEDGYNLLLVTDGTVRASAEWLEKDHDEHILEDIVLIYNEKPVYISDLYTDPDSENTDLFTLNQIKLYIIDYIINGSSTLMPSDFESAVSAFLSPVVTRFTASETQRIILLSFMKNQTKQASLSNLYDVIKFDTDLGYNSDQNGYFKNVLEISEKIADEYNFIFGEDSLTNYGYDASQAVAYGIKFDTTGTYDLYTYDGMTWWQYVESIVDSILTKEETK